MIFSSISFWSCRHHPPHLRAVCCLLCLSPHLLNIFLISPYATRRSYIHMQTLISFMSDKKPKYGLKWWIPNTNICVFQKLSLLITEAYKDAHQKSVQVKTYIVKRKNKHPFAFVAIELKKTCYCFFCFLGHEGKNEWSCSELRSAGRD